MVIGTKYVIYATKKKIIIIKIIIKWWKIRRYDIRCIVKWCVKINKVTFWCVKIIYFFNTTNINALRVISLEMAKYVSLREENGIWMFK